MTALHRAKDIVGWMSDAELLFLAERAKESETIFEIGSYQGRSTRALGDNTNGTVYAIDPWKSNNYDSKERGICFTTDEVIFNLFYCNLHDLIQKKKVIPCISTWMDFKPPRAADFIFIDGDHRYDEVIKDITKAFMNINLNGVIAGHDYAPEWQGVVKAVHDFFPGVAINVVGTIWWVRI